MKPRTIDLEIPTTHAHSFRTRGERFVKIRLDFKMPCYAKDWPRTVGDITAKQLRDQVLNETYAGSCAIGGIRRHKISLSTVIVNGYMYTDDSFFYFNCLNTGVVYDIVYGDLIVYSPMNVY
jgi:hypothetical protein